MSDSNEPVVSDKPTEVRYHEEQAFEHELINRKVTWLLAAQSLLFAAYALAIGANPRSTGAVDPDDFAKSVRLAGLLTSAAVLVAMGCHAAAKYLSWRKWRTRGHPVWGQNTAVTVVSVVADLSLPILFFVIWLTVG